MHADPVGALQLAGRVARREYAWLLLLWLPVSLLDVVADLSIEAYSRAQGFPADPARMTTGESMALLGVGLPLYLLVSTVHLAAWTFVSARVLDRALGGARLAGWRALLPPALVAGFVLTLLYVAGALMLLVGLVVFLHWFLFVPARLAEGARGVGAAFEASRRFARERRTHGFTALVVLLLAAGAARYLVPGVVPGTAGIVVAAALGWVVGPVVPLLAASFVAVAQDAPQPRAPRGAALVRASTTCPRCATLIPYQPTGSAVDVVCPGCGHAGRVL